MNRVLVLLTSLFLVVSSGWAGETAPVTDKPSMSTSETIRLTAMVEAINHETREVTLRGPDGEKLFYQADKQTPYTGWVKRIHDNGQVAGLGALKDGNEDGLSTEWHEDGTKAEKGRFKDGKRDGLRTKWHENGTKEEEGTYKDGQKDGPWTTWDEDGEVVKETRYKDGEEVKE